MSSREHTLDDLVRATGFSKRQIRFYITKRLIPGAGESRGPHATYPEETLQRLLLIRDLKDRPVGPTGRTMTLDEIGHALDSLAAGSAPGESRLAGFEASTGPAELRFQRDAGRLPMLRGSARDYLRSLRESVIPHKEDVVEKSAEEPEPALLARLSLESSVAEPDHTEREFRDTLGRLQALLAELGADTRFTKPQGDAAPWLRVTTPEVEFHVRKPDDHVARARLGRMARLLARLLAREV